MYHFSAKKDKNLLLIPFGIAVLFGVITYLEFKSGWKDNSGLVVIWLVFFLINFLLVLIQKCTKFTITDELLVCKTLFFKKEIPLTNIKKIEKCKGFYAGYKFSTSFSGLIVYYGKFDEVFITPEKEDEFIKRITLRKE